MQKENKHILITRFTALGDVLMTVPVIDALARQYPELRITVVSRPGMASVFGMLPSNVKFEGKDQRAYKGLRGALQLNRELMQTEPDMVCDLHFVNRTVVQDFLFRLKGVKLSHIAKNPLEKIIFPKRRPLKARKSNHIRFAEALQKLGYPVHIDTHERFSLMDGEVPRKGIAIAPFSAHPGKVYPVDMMEQVVATLSNEHEIYLFGAGAKEKAILDGWASKYPNVTNMAGVLPNLGEELRFIAGVQLMVSMDSGNAHLAALAGTRVVTIWGATHPMAGFMSWGQKEQDCLQQEMDCRPCSLFGKKPCRKGDYPCLRTLSVERVCDGIRSAL